MLLDDDVGEEDMIIEAGEAAVKNMAVWGEGGGGGRRRRAAAAATAVRIGGAPPPLLLRAPASASLLAALAMWEALQDLCGFERGRSPDLQP